MFPLLEELHAQHLRVENDTPEFTDYVFTNDSLRIAAPEMIMVPVNNGAPRYRVIEQDVVQVNLSKEASLGLTEEISNLIPDTGTSLFETTPVFEYRKQWRTHLTLNVTRKDNRGVNSYLIARNLKVRVYKEDTWTSSASSEAVLFQQPDSHPLASGNWYRFPVERDGIYRLPRSFFADAGIPIDNIDPRNLQFWGTDGYELPKANAEPRPQWSQIPVYVDGESDGSFDANDYVLIYANDVNRIVFNPDNQSWSHEVHSYSTTNYIYFTVGSSPGARFTEFQTSSQPAYEVSTFRDFIWKKEDLHKPEPRLRSGTHWFGQQFTPQFSNQIIFRDTLAGFLPGSVIDFHARMGARSLTASSFNFTMNGANAGSMSISQIQDLSGDTGQSSRFGFITRQISGVSPANGIVEINAVFGNTSADARGWVDYIHVRGTRSLTPVNGKMHFLSPDDETGNPLVRYRFTGFSSRPVVMDVTHPANPVLIRTEGSGNNWSAVYHGQQGKRLAAQTSFHSPLPAEAVANQNLHGINFYPDYIIVTSELFLDAANDLADYRAQFSGLRPVVVTQEQIFHEFSGGVTDPVAIRDFVRYLYLLAGLNDDLMPKHLLLFGDTTFDYKGIQATAPMKNHVFTFQHYNDNDNLVRQATYGSDDFFAFLGQNEGSWQRTDRNNRLDIGVGRLPVQTAADAELMVYKIKKFEDPANLGDWRTLFTFTADDAINGRSNDRDLHTYNADFTAEQIDADASGIRVRKVYQFSYPVINTPGGQRVPQATEDFIQAINNGTQSIHFSGHGNEQQLTAQRLFQSSDIGRLTNIDKLTIMVTATCSFGRYDDNAEQSGAEKMLLHPNGGAVAALTTTRVVYTGTCLTCDNNFALHIQLTKEMSSRRPDGSPKTLGEVFKNSKNFHLDLTASDPTSVNNRKFILLGDPAMLLGTPAGKMEITSINGNTGINEQPLQLRALDTVQISGRVVSPTGQTNQNFNGIGNLRVFDARRFELLPNPDLYCSFLRDCGFFVQNDVLFNGRVSITNGEFSAEFIVPKDISFSDSTGRIHVYGLNPTSLDASGSFSNFILNGVNEDAENIYDGPMMDVYLNDDSFVNGSLVNRDPHLYVDIESAAGVNTTGSGVGHEVVAVLRSENDPGKETTFILNDFYESALDDFTRGRIQYPLNNLEDGEYSLTVRAWDVFNNVGEQEIFFQVSGGADLYVRNVYNYPNPMHNFTRFAFEHNMAPGQPFDVFIRIFTLSGRPVAQIRESGIVNSNLEMFEWNGRDDDNNRVAAGTYLYHLRVRTDGPNGRQDAEKIERLVIIR